MLSNVLDSIKSQVGSKSYWLGSMVPVILFLAANIVLLYPHSTYVAGWIPRLDGLDQKSLLYSALLTALLAVAYVLSTMTSVMLEALEGKVGPFRWTARLLYKEQWRRLCKIDHCLQVAQSCQTEIVDATVTWNAALKHSLPGSVTRCILGEGWPKVPTVKEAAELVAAVRSKRQRGQCISAVQLGEAVHALGIVLREYKGGVLPGMEGDLREAITYAADRYQFEIRRLWHLRQANFPGVSPAAEDQPQGPTSNNILAPTAMGNIGRAMSTYTLVRYQLDLDIFWSRLQNSLQKDAKEYYAVLQDTKVQVDCAVTMFWLWLTFALFWIPALLWWQDSTVSEFIAVAVIGPVLALGSYLLACQSYRVFAEVMRGSVDLFRFQILQSLHIPLPVGSEEERELWLRLGSATGFWNVEGFQYKHVP